MSYWDNRYEDCPGCGERVLSAHVNFNGLNGKQVCWPCREKIEDESKEKAND